MKKGNEKLFILLFVASFLINLRQCSDSQYYADDVEALEYEITELEAEVMRVSDENNKKQEAKEPVVEVKEVKKFKPRVKAPEQVDSIDSVPEIKAVDSLKVN